MRNMVIQFGAFLWLVAISMSASAQSGFYSFEVNTIGGTPFSFSSLKGKKVMVVNTASECGLTPQYEQLQALWEQYGGDDFVIIGFPANDFLNQEPGTAEEIMEFCQVNYGVTFPMMEKITVVGDDKHPLYQWLTQKSLNGFKDSEVQWNFQKYLIDEKGNLAKVIPPRTRPDDQEIVDWIKQ
ncbi:glutathione peroxidase [Natronoflexus pectinivorans]|uniref:Glutathione peroxidase n=1 Tax=Natronoflexus pectinivorans TaxID=682526 RepID=A0A4R2G5J5_9BACT|nr:glutathione peroxidase [Natronoflexus pectinivorans]TCO02711.1 glutathione peroxidase [Natronoflexus pectinivorans]